MLTSTIGDLLPSAIGVALSPVPIIATVLMLGAQGAKGRGIAFAAGWVVGLSVVSAVVATLVGADDGGGDPSTAVSWGKVALGLVLLALAVRKWRGRPRDGAEAEMPSWMASIDSMGSGRILVLGAALSGLNPKNLALTSAAAATVGQAGLSGGETTAALAVFVVLGSVTVAGPVLAYLVAPARTASPLRAVKDFMATNNDVIVMVLLLVLGAKLLGAGIGAL